MVNKRLAVGLGMSLAACCLLLQVWVARGEEKPPTPAVAAAPQPASQHPGGGAGFGRVKAFFDTYCTECHAGADPEGGYRLTFPDEGAARKAAQADPDFPDSVSRVVVDRAMPPKKAKKKPTDAERQAVVSWLAGLAPADGRPNPGPFMVRRLNNREYANTLRDLLYLPENWDASADFPADERGDGFDTNGDTLTISSVLIEHYLAAAEKSVDFAMNINNKGDRNAQQKLNAPTQGRREDFADFQGNVRRVIQAFLPRAYRRPVSEHEIDEVMKFAALSFTHDGESHGKAAGLAMRAAVMSPEFLFRLEPDPADDGTGKIFEINEFELASRLSYFLWATMPDDELFAAARAGKLRSGLEGEVRRMLKSPKAISLTRDFMGQWLEIRGLEKTANCPPDLLRAMKSETEHYFNHVLQEDRDIGEFLDSDYTFVNQALAEHYGIAGVTGPEFRKVNVDVAQRGGLFTQGSFLTHTAKPLGATRRTSPVNRGKWILENMFNERIPPPPPDVPPLAVDDGKELQGTVRQILEQHRKNPECVSCHERMDPYGLALENYDGFGAWRTRDNNLDLDVTGEIRGERYATPRQFRTLLAARKDDFRRALVTKMLSYALGRGVKRYDKPAIDQICAAVKNEGDHFSSVILNVVRSYPFQHARGSVTSREPQP